MNISDADTYTTALVAHYESYFGVKGKKLVPDDGPVEKLHNEFFVLEFPPNKRHNMYCYCTVGMPLERIDDCLIELVLYSPVAARSVFMLLVFAASYHRNRLPLDLNHTVNIGQPWLGNSKCDHAFVSLPYLDGEALELFHFENWIVHCYWLIPITEKERDYKIDNGAEALEQLFEEKQLDYLNPNRKCLVAKRFGLF